MGAGTGDAGGGVTRVTDPKDGLDMNLSNHGGGGTAVRVPATPVYTTIRDGKEVLVYKGADMVEGRLYEVTWMGMQVALMRKENGVDILKAVADE
ncbi:MAG: hypothetical protein MPI95_04285 [Nitrosopumilus sp.]|nr:hypothetical protein [Nitrosopumilus sp.]CAI9831595.1 hypothetical protein IBTHAUMO2_320021 [Nitrosopumilaceae archaeon]MDA7941561.1 hypothetical protein [Nitrosopumilus sp.]MDA7943586.1 hypothetical protein [Nitrosopumilus sp.]MDA7945048.1 hypothetical protein [Nitrosopumilus sp.]